MKILAFGVVKEIFGKHLVDLELAPGITAGALKDELAGQYPALRQLTSFMVAVNGEYARADTVINAADEVAVIPPVSGG